MPLKFTNFAYSTLAAGVSASDTLLSVQGGDGALFPTLGAGETFYATIENSSLQREIVLVTARSGDALTVTRGQDNTTAQIWLAGDSISLRFNAAALDQIANGYVTRTSATGSGALPAGTTAQRDGTPAAGYYRFNSTLIRFEGYTGSAWYQTPLQSGLTGTLSVPAGTTAERDTALGVGVRYNTTTLSFEGYNGSAWGSLGGGATGPAGNPVVYENDQTLTGTYTLQANKDAGHFGPLTYASGSSFTIPSGARLVIID